jgi:PAS domain S-box-containing protein
MTYQNTQRTPKDPLVQAKDYPAALSELNKSALVSVTDLKGIITYANDNLVATSKYTHQELMGQNHRLLKSGHQDHELFEDLWKTIASGQVWRGEIKNRAKDGSYFWVDTSIAPIFNELGKPAQYLAVRFLSRREKQILTVKERNYQLEQFDRIITDGGLRMIDLTNELTDIMRTDK